MNAGLNLKGEIDITETRYLCDKHFGAKYINNQARRKMLVHTAIPDKWRDDIDESSNPNFTIIGTQPMKKRKFREYTMNELSAQPSDLRLSVKSPPTVLNQRRSSSKFGQISLSPHDEDDQITDDQSEETYKIATKMSKIEDDSLNNTFYEEVFLQPQRQKKVQYIVVKPKPKSSKKVAPVPKTVIIDHDQIEKSSADDEVIDEGESNTEDVYFQEESDISSSNVEVLEDKPSIDLTGTDKTNEIENYSEFIFNGEKYVQMPKRVFEAEKEKLRKESERFKNLLRKLKIHLNKMEL